MKYSAECRERENFQSFGANPIDHGQWLSGPMCQEFFCGIFGFEFSDGTLEPFVDFFIENGKILGVVGYFNPHDLVVDEISKSDVGDEFFIPR